MKMLSFANRNIKEILRDPLNLAFGIGFPVVLLGLLSAIQANIPVSLFEIEKLAPGIAVFGLSFMTLFSATVISKDRKSALLQRLYTTPLTSRDFILGYTLPMIPVSLGQGIVCFILSLVIGLKPTVNILLALVMHLPISILYIALGLLFGSVLNDKQVGGVCGALLTNVSAWLSGIWFDLDLVGGAFKKIAYVLPFVHAVELERMTVSGDFNGLGIHLAWVCGYAVAVSVLAVFFFLKQMKNQ